ncbi:haloacid dehalogenase superfamily, subfamily IA, variant 3 with third motif having DD or ED/haloacid dehalogenase superfamily, subfamily IA, variant 1 with third motif having Dx(3-4)D or Dx(3-4)E [Granulicatella balaenopterae]|uniref:Haloacid dehalogenase superfamily, subfamily IA, variant 3 with third motif having DD or ED/haloacid dehalogenase superfamily, subfamily IA, variant 1 with third motif having Dx(3-4)D or Dx(3-4)E n=1 Tax=Granulicatella balaenopterae TaxID=137733 RepID=A0A1H9P4P2_9LACT|nr:HAD family phosphatase [Granulicatella balaenopterae]SER43160.1 haloacid dehalogenase superfamily, subfamily IA, variant 3 with third motif having DD or ED/haloacid dehalogenase superfamily, subfamily IA, variant 1 with third motif having Dx(3-4)D or Dx(3-4)E [Granulicatella balaenopterae]
MKKISLVIFDMDGLMFDTSRIAYKGYLKAAKKYGFEVNQDIYNYLTGRNEQDIIHELTNIYSIANEKAIEWRNEINKYKKSEINRLGRVYKKEGLVDLMKYFYRTEIKMCIASSSPKELIDLFLEIEDVPNLFYSVYSGGELKHSKPNPDIFSNCCKELGIPVDETIVLEDALVGIQAARDANIDVYWVPDDLSDLPSYEGTIKANLKIIKKDWRKPTKQFASLKTIEKYLENKDIKNI